MTTYDKAGLSEKVLTHLNIEYQITLDLLISWRDITLWFLPGFSCRANVLNILAHRVPEKCINILTVKLDCLLHIIWDIYLKLVSLQPILGFYFYNYAVPLLQSMRHPPIEVGLH